MYGTLQGLRNLLAPGGSSTDQSTAASMSDLELVEALERASNVVDSYVGLRYVAPLALPVPALATDLALNLAAYDASLTFRRGRDLGERDPIALRYRAALDVLRDLRDGTVSLPGAIGIGDLPGAVGGGVAVVNPVDVDLPGDVSASRSPYRWVLGQWPGGDL